jgi:hypothetical protein
LSSRQNLLKQFFPEGAQENSAHPLSMSKCQQTDALNVGLYTTGMRMYRKCTGTRLRKVFTCYHDRKLDHWNMGTFALLQLNFEDHCEMETTTKSPVQLRRDGSTDRDWRLFRQRSQRYQSLQDIPLGLLHLRYIHTRWARNLSLGTERKMRWRKEGSRPGRGHFNNGQLCGKHGNWHSNN